MKHDMTIGEKYGLAMKITDPAKAAEYFEECVQHTMGHGCSREQAEKIEKANLGYYAGYYDTATRERVERLFACAHPIYGSVATNGDAGTDGDAGTEVLCIN